MKGGDGVKQNTVVAVAAARALAGAGARRRFNEGFMAWNSSKWRGDDELLTLGVLWLGAHDRWVVGGAPLSPI
jgi:hypothetical protein